VGFEEFWDEDSIVAIEWAEKFIDLLPKPLLQVEIHIANKDKRDIEIREVADKRGSTNGSCSRAGAFDHIFERL
jgi:tRNA A37 threonylcarbamoyladenosine biosynthesis protein TsaE